MPVPVPVLAPALQEQPVLARAPIHPSALQEQPAVEQGADPESCRGSEP